MLCYESNDCLSANKQSQKPESNITNYGVMTTIPNSPKKENMVMPHNLYTEKNFSEIYSHAEINTSSSVRCDSHTQFDKLKSVPKSASFVYSQMFLNPHNDKGEFYFRYGTVDSYPQLVEIITTTNAKYRTYNELIKENQPTKLAFDLEWCDFRSTGEPMVPHTPSL